MLSLRRLLLILACAAVVLAIVAPAALVWSALYTTGGLQFVIRHLPHRVGPVQLDIVAKQSDGFYQTAEQIDDSLRNRPAQAWLQGDIMRITPLN